MRARQLQPVYAVAGDVHGVTFLAQSRGHELGDAGIVFDDEDTLRLTLGARARWWNGARVQRAPTRWGLMDLEFRRQGDRARWSWSAVPVWTALTLPPGTRLAAPPEAPLVRGVSDRVVLAPPGTRQAAVRLAGMTR